MADRVLLYGPPGSGKSSEARRLAARGYVHLEREQFRSEAAFRSAVRSCRAENVVVVRCCFSRRDLAEWSALVRASRVVLCDPGPAECRRRVFARGRGNWRGEIGGIERWYRSWQFGRPAARRKASNTARGYGYRHQQERKRWARVVDAGEARCCRCGGVIVPGSRWALDHTDDRSGWLGPSHKLCNDRAGGRKGAKLGAAITNARRRAVVQGSRSW